jgi:hypothetical protein
MLGRTDYKLCDSNSLLGGGASGSDSGLTFAFRRHLLPSLMAGVTKSILGLGGGELWQRFVAPVFVR